jgi:peptidyl-prolyl cis-trans isomerase SurA
VDEAIATIELNKGKPEYNVAEIFIPFEAGKSTEKARQIAIRLYSQIQQGANFSALARAFSQSASAGKGGNLGWIRNEQIEQNLSNIMTKMRKNSTSEPMKGESGYYVLNLIDKRKSLGVSTEKIKITLEQLFLPLRINSSENETKVITEQAEDISSSIKTCSALNQKGKELGSEQSGTLEVNDITQLPTNIRTIVQKNDLFKASKPIRTGSGILIIMVCKRSGGGTLKNIRAKIKSMLLQKRAVLTDRSMLRNIRRTAFLDIRQ